MSLLQDGVAGHSPATCHATVGDHAFPVAAARAWNDPPSTVAAVTLPSPLTFRQ